MREYRIKRGYNPDVNKLISDFFGATGNVMEGMEFSVEGIGDISMKQEKNFLIIDIVPPKQVCGDYSIIKKWNEFLLKATGMATKERKKEFGRIYFIILRQTIQLSNELERIENSLVLQKDRSRSMSIPGIKGNHTDRTDLFKVC